MSQNVSIIKVACLVLFNNFLFRERRPKVIIIIIQIRWVCDFVDISIGNDFCPGNHYKSMKWLWCTHFERLKITSLAMGQAMFDVHSLKAKNRVFKFDFQKMNMLENVPFWKNDVQVCSMSNLVKLVMGFIRFNVQYPFVQSSIKWCSTHQ